MLNLGVLKNLSGARKYMKGNVIARENAALEMYIVLKGDVGLFSDYRRQREEMAFTVGAGDYFGEIALLLEKRTPYTAVALTDVIVLPVDKDTVSSFIKDEPDMALELMKAFCTRLDAVSTAYEERCGHSWEQVRPVAEEATVVEQARVAAAEAVQPVQAETSAVNATAAPPVMAAPPPPPAAAAEAPSQSTGFSLFPEGHGVYQLHMHNDDQGRLMDKSYTCPICGGKFTSLKVMNSKLVLEGTDSDMRNRYKGVEPLYYDVVSCPHCLYSALPEMFANPTVPKAEVAQALEAIKPGLQLKSGAAMDTFSVFAGYYLALFCAPKCFATPHLATAKLLLKLSRIYQDCGDKQMEEKTARQALDAYLYVYEHVEVSPNQDQQLCIVIGELCLKVNDLKRAQDFFFKANGSAVSTPMLKNHAQNRILDIRAMANRT